MTVFAEGQEACPESEAPEDSGAGSRPALQTCRACAPACGSPHGAALILPNVADLALAASVEADVSPVGGRVVFHDHGKSRGLVIPL